MTYSLSWMYEAFSLSGGDQLKKWQELGRFEPSPPPPAPKPTSYEYWWAREKSEAERLDSLVGFERRKEFRRKNFGRCEQGSRREWSGGPIDTVRRRRQNGTPPLRHEMVRFHMPADEDGGEWICERPVLRTRAARLIGGRKAKKGYEFMDDRELAAFRERQGRPRLRNEPGPAYTYWWDKHQYVGPKLAYASLAGDERKLVLA